MSRVRHVYANPGEYIAVHRKKSYSYSGGSIGNYSSVFKESTYDRKSAICAIIAKLIAIGITIAIGVHFSIWSILWVIAALIAIVIKTRLWGAIYCIYAQASIFLIIPGLFIDFSSALFIAFILGPIIGMLAHLWDPE